MLVLLLRPAFANDCGTECFELEGWSGCGVGVEAEAFGPGEVDVVAVLSASALGPWTLSRDGEALFEERTFTEDEATGTDTAQASDCAAITGLAFVTHEDGVPAGTHTYVLEGGPAGARYEADVTVDGSGCGCAGVPGPGLVLGGAMLAAGVLLARPPTRRWGRYGSASSR